MKCCPQDIILDVDEVLPIKALFFLCWWSAAHKGIIFGVLDVFRTDTYKTVVLPVIQGAKTLLWGHINALLGAFYLPRLHMHVTVLNVRRY